jgi:hypothetical protein
MSAEYLKHLIAQGAIDPQSSLSHGLGLTGQQSSMGSEANASIEPAAPAAGSVTTDSAIRILNMVRANAILQRKEYFASALGRSRDDLRV